MSVREAHKREDKALRRILSGQARRYPIMQPADLYKLLHQAALGSEHAAPGDSAARAWLEREIASLGEGPEEPAVDPISPSRDVVRVHLRPYLAAGGDPEALLAAFLRTAREFRGSPERLREWGLIAAEMADEGRLPFEAAALRGLLREKESRGFPAAHHSPIFQAHYRPAYRVVALGLFELSRGVPPAESLKRHQ